MTHTLQIYVLFMRKIFLIPLVSILCFCCSPEKKSSKEYMLLDSVIYAHSIQKLETLCEDSMTLVTTSIPYIKNFAIIDSLLFVDTNQENGQLNILSINGIKSYGALLDKGRGRGEFGYGIHLTLYTTFEHHKDSLYANLYDLMSGRLYRINITKQVTEGKCHIQEIILSEELPRSAFWAKTISDTLVFLKSIDHMETRQTRSIITKNGRVLTNVIDKMNELEIPAKEDFNLISSLIAFSESNNMFVEAMIGMNYINIYSLQKDKGVTVCIGRDLDKLSSILSTPKFERKYVFADLRTYNFGFAVLKYDIEEKAYQSHESFHPSILMFDWNGNPIGEIASELTFNHFDIDVNNGYLYILDKDGRLLKKRFTAAPQKKDLSFVNSF